MPQQILRSLAVTAALLAAAGLAGCASQPQSNAALDQVHQRLAQLEQNPVAKQQAGGAVNQAEQSVADADKAFRGGDTAEFNHALFMAERQLSTAEAQVRTQTARAQLSQLSGERDQILLHSRTAQLQQRNAQLAQAQQELNAYRTRETSEGTVVTLYNLPFETGKATLQPGAAARLQPLVSYLHEHPDRHVTVEGNTDSTGRSEVNQRLSQDRADAVRNFLVANGISADRITAQGLGSSYPVASNDTAAGRLQNRRVDVVIEPAQAAALPPATR